MKIIEDCVAFVEVPYEDLRIMIPRGEAANAKHQSLNADLAIATAFLSGKADDNNRLEQEIDELKGNPDPSVEEVNTLAAKEDELKKVKAQSELGLIYAYRAAKNEEADKYEQRIQDLSVSEPGVPNVQPTVLIKKLKKLAAAARLDAGKVFEEVPLQQSLEPTALDVLTSNAKTAADDLGSLKSELEKDVIDARDKYFEESNRFVGDLDAI